MVNYSNGKIYKIEPINGEEGDIYIGSTTKVYLSQRLDTHRSNYKGFLRGEIRLITSFNLFNKYGVENCKIILLELVNVNTKDELLAREAHYIKTLNCVNKVIPLRTDKEYKEDNIEHIKKYNKEYRENNKDKIKEYQQQNKEKIKVCDKMRYLKNIEADPEYNKKRYEKSIEADPEYNKKRYEKNKDKAKEYQKKYREANKDKINESKKNKQLN